MTTTLIRAALALGFVSFAASSAFALDNGQPAGAAKAPAAAPLVTSGTCTGMTVINHKEDNSTSAWTTSSSFAAVPNTTVAFSQGSNGCVVVTFSAETYAPHTDDFFIARAVLDTGATAQPGPVTLSGNDDENNNQQSVRTHGFTFVFPSVTAGAHSVTVQYRSFNAGHQVFVGKHSVLVTHN